MWTTTKLEKKILLVGILASFNVGRCGQKHLTHRTPHVPSIEDSAFLRRGCASVLEEHAEILGCHKGLQMFSGKHWKKAGKTSKFESLNEDVLTEFCCYRMFQVQLINSNSKAIASLQRAGKAMLIWASEYPHSRWTSFVFWSVSIIQWMILNSVRPK